MSKPTYKSQMYNTQYMSFDSMNTFREREGLPPIRRGERNCLCCQITFYSEDLINIRMCIRCKRFQDRTQPEQSFSFYRE